MSKLLYFYCYSCDTKHDVVRTFEAASRMKPNKIVGKLICPKCNHTAIVIIDRRKKKVKPKKFLDDAIMKKAAKQLGKIIEKYDQGNIHKKVSISFQDKELGFCSESDATLNIGGAKK